MVLSDRHPPIGGRWTKKPAAEAPAGTDYDTFEDGDYTNDPTWTAQLTGGGSVSVAAAAKKDGVYGLRFTTDGDNDEKTTYLLKLYSASSLNVWAYIRSSDVSETAVCYCVLDEADRQMAQLGIYEGTFLYTDGAWKTFTATPVDNTWYRLRLTWDKSTNKNSVYVYQADGTTLIEAHENLDSVADGTLNTNRIAMECIDHEVTVVNVDFDNVCYQDTVEPE